MTSERITALRADAMERARREVEAEVARRRRVLAKNSVRIARLIARKTRTARR